MPYPRSNIERIDLWGSPGLLDSGLAWSDELFQFPEVRPVINPDTGFPTALFPPVNPPGTFQGQFPAPTLDDVGMGVVWANWVQYCHQQYLALGYEDGFTNYSISPNYIGGRDAGLTELVFGYATDTVTGGGPGMLGSPLHANGLAFSKAQFETAVASLKTELDARELPYPTAFHDDNEAVPVGQAIGPGGGYHLPLINGTEPRGDIDEMYDSGTYLDKWNEAGVVTSYDPTKSILDPANESFYYFLTDLIDRTKDRVQGELIADAAKATFPGVVYSCYGVTGNSGANPAPSFYHWIANPLPRIAAHADYLSLPLYLLQHTYFNRNLPRFGVDAWMTRLGLTPTSDIVADLRSIAVALAKAQIDALFRAMDETGIHKPLYCWLMTTDYYDFVPAAGGLPGAAYHATEEMIREIARYAIEKGVRAFVMFFNPIPRGPGQPGLSEFAKARMTTLIRDMRSWAVNTSGGGSSGTARYSLQAPLQHVGADATVGMVQVTAPPDRTLKVLELSTSFDGTSQSAKPASLEFVRMTVPGIGTPFIAKKLDPGSPNFDGTVLYGVTGGTPHDLGGGDLDIPYDDYAHLQGNPKNWRAADCEIIIPAGDTALYRVINGNIPANALARVIVEAE